MPIEYRERHTRVKRFNRKSSPGTGRLTVPDFRQVPGRLRERQAEPATERPETRANRKSGGLGRSIACVGGIPEIGLVIRQCHRCRELSERAAFLQGIGQGAPDERLAQRQGTPVSYTHLTLPTI